MIQANDEGERTLWCGNIHDKVTEELLHELFLQVCNDEQDLVQKHELVVVIFRMGHC